MRLARRCGISAAEVEFVSSGEREVLLVKRFDRYVNAEGGVSRALCSLSGLAVPLSRQRASR